MKDALLWVCQTEAISQTLIPLSIPRQSFGCTVCHLKFNETRIDGGSNYVLDVILPLGKYCLHGWQGGRSAGLDICINLFHDVGGKSQLLGGFVGSIGVMDIGHYGGQFVEKCIVAIDL